jgi:hypothetical protein
MEILINLYSYNNTLYSGAPAEPVSLSPWAAAYLIKKKQVNLLKVTIATAIL